MNFEINNGFRQAIPDIAHEAGVVIKGDIATVTVLAEQRVSRAAVPQPGKIVLLQGERFSVRQIIERNHVLLTFVCQRS